MTDTSVLYVHALHAEMDNSGHINLYWTNPTYLLTKPKTLMLSQIYNYHNLFETKIK